MPKGSFCVLIVVCGFFLGVVMRPADASAQTRQELSTQADALFLQTGQLRQQGKYPEAQRAAERLIQIERILAVPISYAAAIELLGHIYSDTDQLGKAEELHKHALEVRERAQGPDHEHVAFSCHSLANVYRQLREFLKADELYKRAIAISERVHGPDSPQVAVSLTELGASHFLIGRVAEAEPLFRRAITILEKAPAQWDRSYAQALRGMGFIFQEQGKFDEAETLFKKASAIFGKPQSMDRAHLGASLHNLGFLYQVQGRYREAEEMYLRAIELDSQTFGSTSFKVAQYLEGLGYVHRATGNFTEAEKVYKRAESNYRRNNQPGAADSIQFELATLNMAKGQHAKAAPVIIKMLPRIQKAVYGRDHTLVAEAQHNLGIIEKSRKRWPEAVTRLRESSAMWQRLRIVGSGALTSIAVGPVARDARETLHDLVEALWHMSLAAPAERNALATEALTAAQYAAPTASGSALAQMTARLTAGDTEIGKLVREAQDLSQQRPAVDKLLAEARGATRDQRGDAGIADLQARLDRINGRLKEIEDVLAKRFPEYAEFANPRALTLADIQGLLRPSEALVAYLTTAHETFVWAVSREGWEWRRIETGPEALAKQVVALRCGLDHSGWRGAEGAARCLDALGLASDKVPGPNDALPFDLGRAHELYAQLLGPVAGVIKGKDLLIVPSGAMTQVPFQVLVTAPPAAQGDADALRDAAWLGVTQSLTALPTVASIKTLRQNAGPSRAAEPFLGVGDPVLAGNCAKITIPASCPDGAAAAQVAALAPRSALDATRAARGATAYFRSGQADLAQLRQLCPLPDTAHELRCVAKSLGAQERHIILGKDATETRIKALSANGTLSRYRVLHFATHGLLAGEAEMMMLARAEPALVLTPPADGGDVKALAEDDGLLTASEIAALKLDADWVILSACNTAGGGAKSTEALSGLARAFFYAGARALLVSHWEVYSDAAVKLTTRAFAELRDAAAASKPVGRAEAMRLSMQALIKQGGFSAHPSYWAPFVVVGEGAIN